MNLTDLVRAARITAKDLLAIVNNGDLNTAYAVDKMREAAHLLDRLATIIAPPVAEDRDDETLGHPSPRIGLPGAKELIRRREFFRALEDAERVRDVIKHRSALSEADAERIVSDALYFPTKIGHDIGADGWHREQALWADKHRSRRDDIGRS